MARRIEEEGKRLESNGTVRTYRDLVENVREVEGNELSPADRNILAKVVQDVVLPNGVSLDDPIGPSVLDWIAELPAADDPEWDLACNIASSMAVEDALQFFVERRHLEPYLDGAFVEEPMDFNSLLDIALTNVLYDWVLAFIELAQQVRAELSAAGK